MTSFAAPWDRRLQISSALLGTAILVFLVLAPMPPVMGWWIRGGLLLAMAATWAWAPTGYRLDQEHLAILRPMGELRIPLRGLHEARRTRPDEFRGAVRIWGVGGLFGYYGRFLVGYETQTWYCTDRSRGVRLEWPGRIVVISPSDPDEFLRAVNAPAHART